MYDNDLKTKLKSKPKKNKTCTFYCRGIEIRNKNFAKDEAKRLRFATLGKYIDALIEYRRSNSGDKDLYEEE